MASAEEIAAEFEAVTDFGASMDVMRLHLAPQVRAEHVPLQPGDGIVERDVIFSYTGLERDAVMRALPEGRLANEVTIDGEWVIVKGLLRGALADGTIVNMPSEGAYRVSGGKIVAIRATMEPAHAATFLSLLKEGQFNPQML